MMLSRHIQRKVHGLIIRRSNNSGGADELWAKKLLSSLSIAVSVYDDWCERARVQFSRYGKGGRWSDPESLVERGKDGQYTIIQHPPNVGESAAIGSRISGGQVLALTLMNGGMKLFATCRVPVAPACQKRARNLHRRRAGRLNYGKVLRRISAGCGCQTRRWRCVCRCRHYLAGQGAIAAQASRMWR